MATLRSELMANGNGLAQLQSSISDAVSNAISRLLQPRRGGHNDGGGDRRRPGHKLERDVTKGSSSRMSSSRALLSKMGLPSMSPPSRAGAHLAQTAGLRRRTGAASPVASPGHHTTAATPDAYAREAVGATGENR